MCQVLQPVQSKVKQAKARGQIGLNQRPGSVRDQYLPAVPSSRDPSGPVNVDTHIVASGEMALSGMQAHPDTNGRGKRRICQPPLNMGGGSTALSGLRNTTKNESPSVLTSAP